MYDWFSNQYCEKTYNFFNIKTGWCGTHPYLPVCLYLYLMKKYFMFVRVYSQTCLSDPHRKTTSFVIRPYLFLPSVFPMHLTFI
jgi:hypothetical protein